MFESIERKVLRVEFALIVKIYEMDSENVHEEPFEKSSKFQEMFRHLDQTDEGRKVATNLINKFKAIEEKYKRLDTQEQEIFDKEYDGKIHSAFSSLNKVVDKKIKEESEDRFNLNLTFTILFVLLFG